MDAFGNTTDTKKPNIPGFLTKTFEIFSNEEYSDLCGWGENGDTIVIKKVAEFSATVLPKYFKHSNFQSFVRQLNMYDFHKTVQDPSHGEFKHEYFKKGRADLLRFIKRKVSQPAVGNVKGTSESVATTTAVTATTGSGSSSAASAVPAISTSGTTTTTTAPLATSLSGSVLTTTESQVGSKAWQRRQEQRLNSVEDANRILMQENQVLFHTVNQQGIQIRLLKDYLGKLVGVMNEYTEGSVPSIKTLKHDIEHHSMPAPLALAPPGSIPSGALVASHTDPHLTNTPLLALPASITPTTTDAVATHVTSTGPTTTTTTTTTSTTTPPPPISTAAGSDLARTYSLEQFWRGQSLNSLPSFGPELADLPPDFLFSRMGSLERLHSFDRTSSVEKARKRVRLANNPEALALHDQLEMLRKNQQEGFQRIDSLEQQLTTLFEDGDLVDLDENEVGVEQAAVATTTSTTPAVPHVDGGGEEAMEVNTDVGTDSEPTTPPESALIPSYHHLSDLPTAPPTTTTYSSLPSTAPATSSQAPLSFPPGPGIAAPQVTPHHMEGGALVKQEAYLGVPPQAPPLEAGMISRRML